MSSIARNSGLRVPPAGRCPSVFDEERESLARNEKFAVGLDAVVAHLKRSTSSVGTVTPVTLEKILTRQWADTCGPSTTSEIK